LLAHILNIKVESANSSEKKSNFIEGEPSILNSQFKSFFASRAFLVEIPGPYTNYIDGTIGVIFPNYKD